jgi:hypothetical protein
VNVGEASRPGDRREATAEVGVAAIAEAVVAASCATVLLRPAYVTMSNTLAVLRLLFASEGEKD